ncbi:MAG TPA: TonB family protein [Polyangia bacterium]
MSTYLGQRRRLDPLLLVGVAISVLLHGGMAAAILFERTKEVKPVEVPREFVVAKMVKLGQKRPKNWLPSIPPRVTAQAPKKRVGLTENEHAAPTKKKDEDKALTRVEEGKAIRRANDLAKVFAEAQKEQDGEGDPKGSPTGTATEATPGDEYATACAEAIQKVWTVPPDILLPDTTLARLSAHIRVIIDGTGKVYGATVKEPSKNRYFDASLQDALKQLKRLPAPPKSLVKDYPKVGIILVFEGKDVKR